MGLIYIFKIQMWIYDLRLHIVFLLFNIVWVESKETIIRSSNVVLNESIFYDLFKNVTSGNNFLQDLIKAYERLKNIFNSTDDSSTSKSDIEADEASKASGSNEISNQNKEVSFQSLYDTVKHIFFPRRRDDSDIIVIQSVEGKAMNSASIANLYDKTSSESDEIKIIRKKTNYTFLEKKARNGKRKLKSKSPKRNNPSKNVKAHYIIQNEHLTRDVKRNFNEVTRPNLRLKNKKDKQVKRIVYAEIFSPDRLWQEIVHKPINLKVYDDDQVSLKIPGQKILATKNKNKAHENNESSSDSKPDDEIIEKEQLTSYLLRNAYGDACLQVAVRKCYKALKAVCKTVCRMQSKCKSSLKSSFKENSKKGCIREFTNRNNKSEHTNVVDISFDRRALGDTKSSKYIELCLPAMRIGTQDYNEKKYLRNDTPDYKNINILRDRFEKACKKLSAKKCTKACKYATNTACSTHSCGSKKKAFTKACKRECKHAYNLFKESDSDDDDDDDDESESESD